ncbi:hypothetical protein [Catenulispora subtropica]|uniref:Uncharacterized protein n=1 Tax=Catenulispora subtropica TaxID=450798 RepID=A0ABN2R180_9ACTN
MFQGGDLPDIQDAAPDLGGAELGGQLQLSSGQPVRCSLLRPDPAQRARIEEIRDNLIARIAEAEHEGWLGEVEGLRVSLACAEDKLGQLDHANQQRDAVVLGVPVVGGTVGHTIEAAGTS